MTLRSGGVLSLPGIRTFQSAGFRRIVAVVLWAVWLAFFGATALVVARGAAVNFAYDFGAYRQAALHLLAGMSPYSIDVVVGPANAYVYPPPFAQLMVPFALVPRIEGSVAWLGIQFVLVCLGLWLATGATGTMTRSTRFLAVTAAATLYLPITQALWLGNAEALLVFGIGAVLTGAMSRDRRALKIAGAMVSAMGLMKLAPFAIVPAGARRDRPILTGVLVAAVGIVGVSVAVSPNAWVDFMRVGPALAAAPAESASNIALANQLKLAGAADPVVAIARWTAVGVGLLLIGASVLVAKQDWPRALLLAVTGGLLIPSVIWYHYLGRFLPIAAFAIVAGGAWGRALAILGLALVDAGYPNGLVALAGASVLTGALLVALPRRDVQEVPD